MIKLIDNFLTEKECDDYILFIENLTKERNIPFSDTANNFNHKYIDNDLAKFFYDRCLDKNALVDCGVTGHNNLVMLSKYSIGENFGLHTDTGLYYNRDTRIKTRYTLLIYLNDNFKGGKTIFYDDNFKVTKVVTPKKGSCLIFDIDLWHEGKTVLEGTKYWIGCELLGKMN